MAEPTLPGGLVDRAVPDHGGLILRHGCLWGVTTAGGVNGDGVLLSINPKTGKYRNVNSFRGVTKGAFGIDDPVLTRTRDGCVVLYGMTKNCGTVQSNFDQTPIAPDWDPTEPALANGTIWRLVLGKKKR